MPTTPSVAGHEVGAAKQFVIIDAFARQMVSSLLRRLAFLSGRATHSSDPTLIVELCNALERFELCLSLFIHFYPRAEAKKIRRRVRKISRLSRHVRAHDVALAFVKEARQRQRHVSGHSRQGAAIYHRLVEERKLTVETLQEYIRKLNRRAWSRRWRARLGA